MTRVVLDGLVKHRDRVAVVDSVSLALQPGELAVIVGPPRSGKSSLARLIAGLDRLDAGEIYFNGRVMNSISPVRRGVGLIFQSDDLWPHLSVEKQVNYPLKLQGIPRRERRRRVIRALSDARVDASAHHKPAELPWLLRKRAALARVLVVDPEVLVLDDPFENLEPREREEFSAEVHRVHGERNLTTILMTQQPRDGFQLADRMALMDLGRIVQDGLPTSLYSDPASPFAATFLGEANLLSAHVEVAEARGSVIIRTPIGRLVGRTSLLCSPAEFQTDDAVTAIIRPEAFQLGPPIPADSNRFAATVTRQEFLGSTCRVEMIGPNGWHFQALILSVHAADFLPGESRTISVPANQVLVLSTQQGTSR